MFRPCDRTGAPSQEADTRPEVGGLGGGCRPPWERDLPGWTPGSPPGSGDGPSAHPGAQPCLGLPSEEGPAQSQLGWEDTASAPGGLALPSTRGGAGNLGPSGPAPIPPASCALSPPRAGGLHRRVASMGGWPPRPSLLGLGRPPCRDHRPVSSFLLRRGAPHAPPGMASPLGSASPCAQPGSELCQEEPRLTVAFMAGNTLQLPTEPLLTDSARGPQTF